MPSSSALGLTCLLVSRCFGFGHLQSPSALGLTCFADLRYLRLALQDFTVLPTEKFRRCVIRSSSVIFLPTSSPTEYVRRLYLRRWFLIPSIYQSEKQKNHLPTVLQTESARQKKKDSRFKYTDGFSFRRWNWIYRRKISVVTSVSETENTDGICPSVNSSVLVEATVKWRRIKSVGKSVGESLKYRPNSSVGKILGNSFFLNLFLKNYLGYII